MVCLALELVGPWMLLCFSVGKDMYDELLSINVPWIQEFSDVVKVSWLGRLVLEFWWVELGFFSLECIGVTSNGL